MREACLCGRHRSSFFFLQQSNCFVFCLYNTFHVTGLRSADRALNLCIGVAMCFTLFNVGRGVHQLANGYGRKEGF